MASLESLIMRTTVTSSVVMIVARGMFDKGWLVWWVIQCSFTMSAMFDILFIEMVCQCWITARRGYIRSIMPLLKLLLLLMLIELWLALLLVGRTLTIVTGGCIWSRWTRWGTFEGRINVLIEKHATTVLLRCWLKLICLLDNNWWQSWGRQRFLARFNRRAMRWRRFWCRCWWWW